MTKLDSPLPAAMLLIPHGLKGAMKAKVDLANPNVLIGKKLSTNREGLTLTVTKIQSQGNRYILHLAEISHRNQTENLGGVILYLPREAIPPAPEGHIYYMDVIGKSVVTGNGTTVGTVTSIMEAPAQPLLVIDNGALIPLHPEYLVDARKSPIVLTEMGEALTSLSS